MGEIKSTLDLVMEKTQGLSLTSEEKERLREAECVCRGESLARRYLSEEIEDQHLAFELSKEHGKNRESLKKTLTRYFLDAVFLARPSHRVFSVLRSLIKEEAVQGLEKLKEDYAETSKAQSLTIEKHLKKELERRGISGSAVIPNVESSPAWQEARSKFEPLFIRELDLLKERILGQP